MGGRASPPPKFVGREAEGSAVFGYSSETVRTRKKERKGE
jgi:hypothetical protein